MSNSCFSHSNVREGEVCVRHLFGIFQDILHRAILLYEGQGALCAHPGHAGYIV